jgi:hypothetical protein
MLLRRNNNMLSFFEMVDKCCGGGKKTFHDFLRAGHYTEQVRDYLDAFDSVRIFMFEDLQRDPAAVVRRIFELFKVNDTGFVPSNINITYNASESPKPGLSRFVHDILFLDNVLKKTLKSALPLRMRLRIKAEFSAMFTNQVEMTADVQAFLAGTYRKSLESLRDLLVDPEQKTLVDNWCI